MSSFSGIYVLTKLTTDLEYIGIEELDSDESIINFRNGILKISDSGLKLLPHSPEYLSTIQIPCDWTDKKVSTPVFDNYLKTLTNGNKALEKVEIPLTQKFWTEEELFENIEKVWIQKGCQPSRRDMDNKNLSNISSGAYLRKYGKWSDALKAFVEYINADEISYIGNSELLENKHRDNHVTKRDVNLRLRFKVFQRDNFKCRFCGASPATDSSIQLHVDHIIPWSKGGETVIENLQTLCSNCNLGKSNLN